MPFNTFSTPKHRGSNDTLIDLDRISAIIPKDENSSTVLVDGEWIDVQSSAAEVVTATGR